MILHRNGMKVEQKENMMDSETPIKAGDVIVTGNGASHSIKNTGTVPLTLHAAIITH
jgi:mannose-6-phosphate isomerase-like protein (cupin superfamily)